MAKHKDTARSSKETNRDRDKASEKRLDFLAEHLEEFLSDIEGHLEEQAEILAKKMTSIKWEVTSELHEHLKSAGAHEILSQLNIDLSDLESLMNLSSEEINKITEVAKSDELLTKILISHVEADLKYIEENFFEEVNKRKRFLLSEGRHLL